MPSIIIKNAKKLKLYYKTLSLLTCLLLLFQSLAPGLFLLATTPSAFAQEASEVFAEPSVGPTNAEVVPTPNALETETVSEVVDPSPTPDATVSPTPTEEVTPTPEITPTPAIESPPTPTPLPTTVEESTTTTSTPTPTPQPPSTQETQTIDQVIQNVVENAMQTVSGWIQNADGSYTSASVRLGETYRYPANDKVSLTFTRLPEQVGTVTIKEIRLTEEQIRETGSLSGIAYDITSSMTNGTFSYNLTLPRPQVSTENPLEVKFSEDQNNLHNAQTVTQEKIIDTETITVRGLDHFTVFLISANTTGGTYTNITSLIITEPAITQIGTGTIILNVPSGFIFDTGSNVTATVTPSTCDAGGNTTIKLAGGALTQTVTPTTTTITVDVTAQSTTNADCASTITFTGMKARPTATVPVALGNITVTGTAALGTSTTSTETLQEIAAITAINTAHADGAFRSGEVIDITLTYTEAVTVNTGGGTPTIALNSGGTASYLSGSGTSTLTFRYTVGGSDSSADLAHSATNSLSLNGGTIRDGVNSGNADNTLPATSTFTGAHAIVIDNIVPASATLSINSGAAYTNTTSVTLTISATDASSPVVQMNIYNGTAFNANNWEAYATSKSWILPSTEGTKTVRARFRDAAGNENSTNLTSDTIILDTTAPVVSGVLITNVATSNNTYLKNGDVVSFTATITDTNQAGITTSLILANLSSLGGGTSVNPTNYNTSTGVATWSSLTVSGTANSTVGITVDAIDPAGNSATQGSDTILADNTAPSGSISAPANNSYSNVNPNFTASPSDTNGITSVKFQYKASLAGNFTDLNTDTSSPFTADWTGVTLTTNTVYNLQILITDVPGNTTTAGSTSFTFDTTAPNLSITSPVNGTTTTTTVPLNLTTNETTTCSYLLDTSSSGTFSTTGGTTHAHTLSGLGTGSHTLSIFCSDLALNSTSSSAISWTVFVSSASTIDASATSPSFNSATDGQADLPSGITSLTLSDSTNLDLSSAVNSVSGGNITVGGSSIALNNFTSGNLSGVNLSTAQSIGGQTVTVEKAVKLESGTNGTPIVLQNSNLSSASVSIPDGATILGPSGWNGTIQPPKTSSTTGSSPSGFSFSGTTIEVGSPDVILLFDTPVVLTFPTSSTIAYKSSGSSSWTQITNTCGGTYDSPTAPAFPGECAINNGSTTKVYTYHFTTFAAIRDNNTPSSTSQTCSDGKPGSAPTLLSAVAGNNQVTLTWSKATDPVSYYLVAYGTSSGTLQYGNPNIGGKDTTSFTVSSLSGGTTYYFKVRAGNGCTPGDYSNEVSVTPGGEIIEGAIGAGFIQGVLGESTAELSAEEEKTKEDKKEKKDLEKVLGEEIPEEKVKTETLSKARTILPIVVVLLLLSGFGFWFFRKSK